MGLKSSNTFPKHGFSIIELLVVIAVVAMLLAIAAPMWMTNSSAQVNSSTYRLSAFFDEARNKAVSRGEPVRILINDDKTTPGQYRQYAIALQWEKEGGSAGIWRQVLRPLLLDKGIFFDFSEQGTATESMLFAIGGAMGQEQRTWRFYEIEANGSPASKIARNVVLGAGILDESTVDLRFLNEVVAGGFRISDASRLVYFQSDADVREAGERGGVQ